jgi:hypothetical protein
MNIMQLSDPPYEILSLAQLEEYLKNHNRALADSDYQLPSRAHVFMLEDGKVVVLPSRLRYTLSGILFHNKQAYEECVVKDRFPIENTDKTVFECEPDKVEAIHQNMPYFMSVLNKTLGIEGDSITKEYVLKAEGKFVDKHRREELTDLDYLAFTAIVGESLRLERGEGKWILIKEYGTYNPYYYPAIMWSDNKVVMLADDISSSIDTIPSKVEWLYRSPFVQNPSLTLGILYARQQEVKILE